MSHDIIFCVEVHIKNLTNKVRLLSALLVIIRMLIFFSTLLDEDAKRDFCSNNFGIFT